MKQYIKYKQITKIGFIGDIHNKPGIYLDLIKKYDATIQVGDFGLKYAWTKISDENVNSVYHKILPGNHEDYDFLLNEKSEYNLGDFGTCNFHKIKFFFVRGAYSIDDNTRIIGFDWWEQEQLSYQQQNEALDAYEKEKPDIMITHTLPSDVAENLFHNMLAIRCSTTSLFQEMFRIHKPKLWICGHFHPMSVMVRDILGTTFVIIPSYEGIKYLTTKTLDENINFFKKKYNE
jgi:Icc-related predicted phosphoesterase